ncbi:MAG: hypothetical protein ACP5NQ_09810, partial [Vulcanisaeta sp.]
MVSIAFPAFNYENAYIGTLEVQINNREITIIINSKNQAKFDRRVPVSPLGTYSVRIDVDAIRSLLGSNTAWQSQGFPIIFTLNSNYGRITRSRITIALLTGVTLSPSANDQNLWLLMGYSQARDRQDGNWVDKTTCHGGPCKLHFFIVIDDQVHQAIENARSNAGCGNNCTFRIKVDAPGNVDAGNARLYLFSLRRVQAFLRSYSIIADISDSNLISYMSNTLDLSLTEGDVETAYIGSQIVAKGMSINVNTGKQRSMYFISPVVIPYPMNVPGRNSSVSLPLDRVLRTAVFELALKDFNWDKAVKLIDWLWSKHRDSVFRLLLSKPVVDSLIVLALGGYRYVRGLYTLESSVLMELYGNRIITYSPSIGKIARAYYRVKNNVAADMLDVVKDLLVELSDGELKN